MWFKVDDSLCHHPKAMQAGAEALGLWTLAGAWSSANLTDGFVPDYMLTRLDPNGEALAEALASALLWFRCTGGYRFHDWTDYQPDAETVREQREKRRAAGRKGGLTSGKSRSKREASAQASGEANAKQNRTPSPSPSPSPSNSSPYGELSRASRRDAEHERFAEFYDAFPKHKDRKDAARKFDQVVGSGVDPDTLIAAAHRYRSEVANTEPRYVKHPATWLNKGSWNDEPDPQPSKQQLSTRDQRFADAQRLKDAPSSDAGFGTQRMISP